MRGTPHLYWAVLGLALSGLTAVAQAPQSGAKTLPPPAPAAKTETLPAPTVSPTMVAATVNGETIYEIAVQRGPGARPAGAAQ